MECEPFYNSGLYSACEMGIYAGWVTRHGSFAGQTFFNEQQDIALVFSGECFVDSQERTDLQRRGHRLGKAAGDWLVHLYEEEGDRFFEKLNGLFSGLLIDMRQRIAFLFNDRCGLERIYWHETEDATYFASEAKALLRVLPKLREFDDQAVGEFLTYGCTLESRTLFRGIQQLPGASMWSFENGKCHKRRYFSPETWEAQSPLAPEDFESQFQETFERVLPRYFRSETDLGISLTGGLDTRMIMACRPKNGANSVCYTFSGERGLTLDDRLAARVAAACGLEHRLLRIHSDFFSNFALHVDRTVSATDGCCGATGAHEIYLNAQARQLAPVRLTGNFGSEILRGVSTFKPIGLSRDLLHPDFERSLNGSVKGLLARREHPVTFAAFREIPWNLCGTVAASRSQVTFRTPYLDNELVALAYQAPECLWKSSRPASRVVRSNSAVLSEIPTDRGFLCDNSGLPILLRRLFSEATFKIDYYNSQGLPFRLSRFDSFFGRLSSGLGIFGLHKYLPYRHWFRTKLASYISEILTDTKLLRMRFWNPDFLNNLAADHITGRRNFVRDINAVLSLEAIDRLLLSKVPSS